MNESDFIATEGIKVIVQDLPTAVKGFCYHDNDGESYIVLNARQTKEQNKRTIDHELNHIKNGDMYNPDFREYD